MGNNSYKNKTNIKYFSYNDCKKFIKENYPEITKRSNWIKFDKNKLPIEVPKRPDHVYKKTGDWINWESFLDSPISPRTKSKKIISFSKAKKIVKKMNFKDQFEFHRYLVENNIEEIPQRPDYVYKKYWKGYLDFLGIEMNKSSIGERIISEYLNKRNISFERERKFNNCIYKKRLRFDFYLPDLNTCIEYDGEHHFKECVFYGEVGNLEKIKIKDKIKSDWCKENNINLIRIHYSKKNKIYEILDDLLLNKELI